MCPKLFDPGLAINALHWVTSNTSLPIKYIYIQIYVNIHGKSIIEHGYFR